MIIMGVFFLLNIYTDLISEQRSLYAKSCSILKSFLPYILRGKKTTMIRKWLTTLISKKVVDCMLKQVKVIHMYPQ